MLFDAEGEVVMEAGSSFVSRLRTGEGRSNSAAPEV